MSKAKSAIKTQEAKAPEAPKTLAAAIAVLDELQKEKQMTQPKKDRLEQVANNELFTKEKFIIGLTEKGKLIKIIFGVIILYFDYLP